MVDVILLVCLALFFRVGSALHPCLRFLERGPAMILNVSLLGLSFLLLLYLLYALLRPEKF